MKWIKRLTVTTVVFLMFILCFTVAHADNGVLRLPADIAVIEEEAFYGDSTLNKVILPQGIEKIGSRAFADSSLRQINLPDSLSYGLIAPDAFDGSQLQYVLVSDNSPACKWALEHENLLGFEIIYFNRLNAYARDDQYWIYTDMGQTAQLNVSLMPLIRKESVLNGIWSPLMRMETMIGVLRWRMNTARV